MHAVGELLDEGVRRTVQLARRIEAVRRALGRPKIRVRLDED